MCVRALATLAVSVGCLTLVTGLLSLASAGGRSETGNGMKRQDEPACAALEERLTPQQYHVTQEAGTEPPFDNAYWDHKAPGIYVDVVSAEPLFSSLDKYDSGTGWPSFTRPLGEAAVVLKDDTSHGMRRVEVRSRTGDSHLGHVFDDGPSPTGKRYCINSAALRFVPVDELHAAGLGRYEALFASNTGPERARSVAAEGRGGQAAVGSGRVDASEAARAASPEAHEIATLAGGCFWGVEHILRDIDGVVDTEVGYTGGAASNPVYETVSTGHSGHAEAVRVRFDPARISYEELLGYFFRLHDPTTLNRQGNDVGTQYRSAIFYHDDRQRQTAARVMQRAQASGRWKAPVVTTLQEAGVFYPAEAYHQDYLVNNPNGYTCHYLRP